MDREANPYASSSLNSKPSQNPKPARLIRNFKYGHENSINQLSVCSDNEHFLSADLQRIVMWHYDRPEVIYNLVELDEPQEFITHCEYHKHNPNLFLYSTTAGYFDYCDFRVCSQLKQAAIRFSKSSKKYTDHFFAKLIRRIGSANFAPTSENYIFSRDFVTISIWDVRNNRQPVQNLNATDYLDKSLIELYENDKIYDTFKLNISPCST